MKLDGIIRNLRALWRADAIIAQIQLHALLTRLGLEAAAAVIAIFGLLCLELAAYFALVQQWNVIAAAIALGIANFAIALTIVLIAHRQRPSQDMHLALELHTAALDALQGDAASVQAEIAAVKNAFARPLDAAFAGLIIPAASLLMKALKKPKENRVPES